MTTGEGFNALASFIFGGNDKKESMNMTTPVYTTSEQKMQFVLEKAKYEKASDVPASTSSSDISVVEAESSVCAAVSVPGIPVEGDVRSAESELRSALERDGLETEPGFELARYNEPYVLPPFRRNEVLVKVKNFSL